MSIKKLAALVLSGVLCLTTFTGCSAGSNEAIATLGNESVSFGVANFICKYEKARNEDVFRSWYGAEVWQQDIYGNGSTLETMLKQSVMDSVHDLYTLKAHMGDYGVTITAEDEKAIDAAVAAFMSSNSKEALDELGATEEIVKEVLTLYTIQAKMYTAITANADTTVTDEEANVRSFSIIEIYFDGHYDENYNFIAYTEEEVAELKATVATMDTELDTEDMETVAARYEMEIYEDTYTASDEKLDATIKAELDKLGEGEVSDVIDLEKAAYFVRLDSASDATATMENKKAIVEERKMALYEEVIAGWQVNDGWTVNEDVLAKIDFHNIITTTVPTTETQKSSEGTESK